MISRRAMIVGSLALSRLGAAGESERALQQRLIETERKHGGRLGVAIVDTATMKRIGHRSNERFPLCSTFKCLAAALVLARVDHKQENLARRVTYAKDQLVPYSPVTEKHVGETGMTIGELCEAAITRSDNTAANLLLDSFGGPAKLTAYLRSVGDSVTRLDRREPELNDVKPGDPRDTTTPEAMLETLRKVVLGKVLSSSSREQLTAWLVANKTGDKRLRAGVPKDWRVADKTGSGMHSEMNDVAVIWPTGRQPKIVAAFYAPAQASEKEGATVLAEVGRIAASV